MKKYTPTKMIALSFFILALCSTSSNAQAHVELAEQRAKLFHEALQSSDKADWEAYIEENYSKAFLEKHAISKHVGMLERLHNDFGKSTISSIKKSDAKVAMVIERTSDKHRVSIELSLDANDGDKVNGISVEAGELK